jgi:ATP synthase protein I
MSDERASSRRADARERTKRDLARFRRRTSGPNLQGSLALLGSVGWPIVVLALGGALLGRYLDRRFETGERFTLALLLLGVCAGSFSAYRTLRGGER